MKTLIKVRVFYFNFLFFLKNSSISTFDSEAKIPSINSKLITVTEVRMTPDLKTARVYVIPLGGVDMKETVRVLTEYSHLVRKALSKRLDIKFLPKLTFVEDNSFEYAEKIEKIIKKIKINDTEKKRYN